MELVPRDVQPVHQLLQGERDSTARTCRPSEIRCWWISASLSVRRPSPSTRPRPQFQLENLQPCLVRRLPLVICWFLFLVFRLRLQCSWGRNELQRQFKVDEGGWPCLSGAEVAAQVRGGGTGEMARSLLDGQPSSLKSPFLRFQEIALILCLFFLIFFFNFFF